MEKGKQKKKREQISIMFVPHSPENNRILKFTTFKYWLGIITLLIVVFIIGISSLFAYMIRSNNSLRADNSRLLNLTTIQNSLINEKAGQINELNQKEDSLTQKVEEFKEKFKEMTDSYISSSKTSRAGDRNEREFIEDAGKLKAILESLDKASKADDKDFADLSDTEGKLKKYTETIPTLWPSPGRVSSEFGSRKDPFQLYTKFHSGIDIAAPYGQDIVASASGKVTLCGWYGTYGYAVIINHGNGISTLYGHTSRLLVREGLTVNKGDVIAKVGSSGNSTGPHLHFEVRINDTPVDPLKYLDR